MFNTICCVPQRVYDTIIWADYLDIGHDVVGSNIRDLHEGGGEVGCPSACEKYVYHSPHF